MIGLECSYIIPIALRLTVARSWFKKGPFHLGPLSYIIGWIGVTWGCFISVVLILPTYYPVTSVRQRREREQLVIAAQFSARMEERRSNNFSCTHPCYYPAPYCR